MFLPTHWDLIVDNGLHSFKGTYANAENSVRHFSGTLLCHLRPMRSRRFGPLCWHSEHISCCPRWCGTHENVCFWPRCWKTHWRLAEAQDITMINFDSAFYKREGPKVWNKDNGGLTWAWCWRGTARCWIKMCRWDSCLMSSLPNNAISLPVCLQNTVSLACCHAHVVSHFSEVPPSRRTVFVMAIQKELPITLLIIKGLKWIHEGVCRLSTV